MKSLKSCTLLLSTLPLLPGCSTNSPAPTTSSQDLPSSQSSTSGSVDLSQLFSDRDFEIGYDEESAVHISLGSPSTSDSDAVTVDGSTVTITSGGGSANGEAHTDSMQPGGGMGGMGGRRP